MARVIEFYNRHPKLVAWAVLAIGMVVMLLWSAKDVGLLPTQTLALVIATIGLAGLCVWIIGWEDSDEEKNCRNPSRQKPKSKHGACRRRYAQCLKSQRPRGSPSAGVFL